MPRPAKSPLQKVTLNLIEGDRDILNNFFPAQGWSVAARAIINRACRTLLERESQSRSERGLDIIIPLDDIRGPSND